MTALVLAYIFNIIILIPIGLMTMLGGEKGGQLACQRKFPESEGFRTLLGSLWTAILIGSVLGLFFPITMSALLLIQVIYKTLWLLVYAMPRMLNQRSNEVPWGIASTFLIIIVTYPWIIPWGSYSSMSFVGDLTAVNVVTVFSLPFCVAAWCRVSSYQRRRESGPRSSRMRAGRNRTAFRLSCLRPTSLASAVNLD